MMRPDHTSEQGTLPFSRPIAVDYISDEGTDITIKAEPTECPLVAKEVGLPSIGALGGDFHVARRPGGRLNVTGVVRATISQVCVVSLEPFESEIEQHVEIDFAPEKTTHSRGDDLSRSRPAIWRRRRADVPDPPSAAAVEVQEDDPPDPILDGRIDLGAVAVEFLTLALDFYPRKPGVLFTDTIIGETDAAKASAFAGLERLKDRS